MIKSLIKQNILLVAILGLYSIAILEDLTKFPPYFFCDEAIVGVEAQRLLASGRDLRNKFLLLFFPGFGNYCLSLTVYLQSILLIFFNLSEWTIRAQAGLISVAGAFAIYGILKNKFNHEQSYLVIPILYASPLWFLFSRTGFGVAEATSFYFISFFFYLQLLEQNGRYKHAILYAVFAAASFYSYVAARGWILALSAAMLFTNAKRHKEHWKKTLLALAVFSCLLLPYLVFFIQNPELATKRASELGLFENIKKNPTMTLGLWKDNALLLFDPSFWFFWNPDQAAGAGQRNIIPELAAIPTWLLPFFCLGILTLIDNIRCYKHRSVLVAFLVSIVPGVFVEASFLRCMPTGIWFLITALIGLDTVQKFLFKASLLKIPLKVAVFFVLVCYAGFFRYHVFNTAARGYGDYGFYGLQTGSSEIFNWIKVNSKQYDKFFVSASFFNQGDIFIPFFLDDNLQTKVRIFDPNETCPALNQVTKINQAFVIHESYWATLSKEDCQNHAVTVKQFYDPTNQPLFRIIAGEMDDIKNETN